MECLVDVIRIGTRGSKLALAQAHWVGRKLEEGTGLRVEIVAITTRGDRFLDLPVTALSGKGIFVKEIEEALLRGEIDLAVHSLKDLPSEFPRGLGLAAILERENPADVLVSRSHLRLKDLPRGATVGTGSFRRQAQILHYRPDLHLRPVRGNIDTRLKKLEKGEMDALVMAAAGLKRIGCEDRVTEYLSPEICVSAAGQGAIAVEGREGHWASLRAAFLNHPPTAAEVTAERAFLRRLGGGCQIPVGALARLGDEHIRITGVVADQEGTRLFRDEVSGAKDQGERLGETLAERLLEMGAGGVLLLREKENVPRGAG